MESAQLPLRDIHLPEPVGWWPPAPGWWLLAVFIPLIIGLLFWLYKKLTKKTAIKAARKQLLQIKQSKDSTSREKLQAISSLFRRVAISIAGRYNCAGLTGQEWLDYLDRTGNCSTFKEGIGHLLIDAPYRQSVPTDQEINQLIGLCENWLAAQNKRSR